MTLIGKTIHEDEWLKIYLSGKKAKTYVFNVYSKCTDDIIGVIHWYPSWRAYTFEPTTDFKIELSDRCQIATGGVTMWLNAQHKMKYKNLLEGEE